MAILLIYFSLTGQNNTYTKYCNYLFVNSTQLVERFYYDEKTNSSFHIKGINHEGVILRGVENQLNISFQNFHANTNQVQFAPRIHRKSWQLIFRDDVYQKLC